MPQTITPINAGCHKFQTSTFNVFVIPVQTKIKFKINATGITDVISFYEENIVAQTTMGVLIIRGDKLHINSLNLEKGTLNVDGNITSLMYDDDEGMQKNSFFAKLFK